MNRKTIIHRQRRAAGLCTRCGKERDHLYKMCLSCVEVRRRWWQRYKKTMGITRSRARRAPDEYMTRLVPVLEILIKKNMTWTEIDRWVRARGYTLHGPSSLRNHWRYVERARSSTGRASGF